jgi:hypothetical protein
MKKVVGQLLRYRPHFLWVNIIIFPIQQIFAQYRLKELLFVTKRYWANFLYLEKQNKEYPDKNRAGDAAGARPVSTSEKKQYLLIKAKRGL